MISKYKDDPKSKAMYERVYDKLKRAAESKDRKLGYAPIFDIMGLKPGDHAAHEAGILLGEICAETTSKGLPMLSAIVVSETGKDKGKPGPGFYNLAIELGRLPANATDEEKDVFWRKEVNKVHSTDWTKC